MTVYRQNCGCPISDKSIYGHFTSGISSRLKQDTTGQNSSVSITYLNIEDNPSVVNHLRFSTKFPSGCRCCLSCSTGNPKWKLAGAAEFPEQPRAG